MQSDYEGAAEQAKKQHAKTISIENTTINRNNAMKVSLSLPVVDVARSKSISVELVRCHSLSFAD